MGGCTNAKGLGLKAEAAPYIEPARLSGPTVDM